MENLNPPDNDQKICPQCNGTGESYKGATETKMGVCNYCGGSGEFYPYREAYWSKMDRSYDLKNNK